MAKQAGSQIRITLAAALAIGTLISPTWAEEFDHTGVFGSSYSGAQECMSCHAFISGAVDLEVMNSIHYQLRTENPNVAIPGGGSHGMIDRACALRGTSMFTEYEANCGACHVGVTRPFGDPQTGEPYEWQVDNIDCLVCHAPVYDMDNDGVAGAHESSEDRVRGFRADLGFEIWHQDRMVSTAETVGTRVTRDACLRCHEHGQGDYVFKRGTPFSPETDVHAARGFNCTSCHRVRDHQIARGSRVADMHGWERQDVEVDCTNCHSSTPHTEWPAYNLHTTGLHGVMACETCHIPWTAGVERRVWTSTYGVTSGPESNVPTYNAESGRWEYHEEDTDGLIRPVYRWFNGGASMLAEPMANPNSYDFQLPNRSTPGARIYPFRNIVNGMVMDRRGIAMDPEFDPQFTMLAAFQAQAPTYIAMGFMRPEGLNAAEQNLLSQFPNLLMFSWGEYFATGDVTTSVNLGQGQVAAMMSGMNTATMTREELIALGQMTWSGQPTGLDLPDNPFDPTYVADMDPTTAVGSFIQLSHAISRDNALRCVHCHSPEGVMDFNTLLYSPDDQYDLSHALTFKSHEQVVDHLLGRTEFIGSERLQADANQDDVIDISDVVLLSDVGL
ncbi:hypothetical protein JXA47_02205 [Candidatus Sumerlaeota bacterium]|nr:hypothetical protein [Candidatus Sumerlaeota bacterium]